MEPIQLKLILEINGEQYNLANTTSNSEIDTRILKLRKKIFIFDNSQADEKYFKQRIVNYLLDKDLDTLTKVLWDATHIRKNRHHHFNEGTQRITLDNSFVEWAQLMCKSLNAALVKFNDFSG